MIGGVSRTSVKSDCQIDYIDIPEAPELQGRPQAFLHVRFRPTRGKIVWKGVYQDDFSKGSLYLGASTNDFDTFSSTGPADDEVEV